MKNEIKKIYYEIEEMELQFENLDDALNSLNNILSQDCNYMYRCNRDNVYTLSKVVEYKDIEDLEYDTVINMSVRDYESMSYERKKEIFG